MKIFSTRSPKVRRNLCSDGNSLTIPTDSEMKTLVKNDSISKLTNKFKKSKEKRTNFEKLQTFHL